MGPVPGTPGSGAGGFPGSGLPGSGVPGAGSPSGVNPNQAIVIGDLGTYLSRAYQAGVDPARPSTVTSLYPLSVNTLNSLVGVNGGNLYGFPCGALSNTPVVYGQGTVSGVEPGMIQVQTNNGLVNLQVSGCTNLEATRQNAGLSTQVPVYYRGVQAANGAVNLHSLTCVY